MVHIAEGGADKSGYDIRERRVVVESVVRWRSRTTSVVYTCFYTAVLFLQRARVLRRPGERKAGFLVGLEFSPLWKGLLDPKATLKCVRQVVHSDTGREKFPPVPDTCPGMCLQKVSQAVMLACGCVLCCLYDPKRGKEGRTCRDEKSSPILQETGERAALLWSSNITASAG